MAKLLTPKFSSKFKKQYKKLRPDIQKKMNRQLQFLSADPMHPSLQTRKLMSDIWYFRVDRKFRATFQWERDTIVLRNVDEHDDAL
jgi:mRNA-degrading endonuclease RelE of RelBE toxin-antitoxin system